MYIIERGTYSGKYTLQIIDLNYIIGFMDTNYTAIGYFIVPLVNKNDIWRGFYSIVTYWFQNGNCNVEFKPYMVIRA